MEKRLITAIILSVLMVFLFQNFVVKPQPPTVSQVSNKEVVAQSNGSKAVVMETDKEPVFEEKEIAFESERYKLTFSNVGGGIKSVDLKNFKGHKSEEPLSLLNLKNPREYIFNINDPLDPDNASATSEYTINTEGEDIVCSTRTKNFQITKKIKFRNTNDIMDLQVVMKNISGKPQELGYNIISGAGLTESVNEDKRFIEIISKINDKRIKYKQPKSERLTNVGNVNWTALKNRYFSIIMKPLPTTKGQYYYENKSSILVNALELKSRTVEPDASVTDTYILYVGPGSVSGLTAAGNDFIDTLDYGFFGGISKVLIFVLRFFYGISRSWGIAIVLLAIFLNVITFPLTAKSFKSMQKMQELHPQMEKLKAQYKDNSQKLNVEMVQLYKKYNINPLSGCLPMLLQMPIFIALYQALMKAIELRGSKFLWINDLSSAEAIPIPLSLPIIGNTINILPLVMIAAMVAQQKLSSKYMGGGVTDEQKQQQKMMLILMPVIFGFIFYNMPSGLVLYWVINTVLTALEQVAILRKN